MGDRIGPYRRERVLGAGGFATVWLAYDERLRTHVAIKVLSDSLSNNPAIRERFEAEARFLFHANSDRLVRVYFVDVLPTGQPYFVMQLADRGTLEERLIEKRSEGASFSIGDVASIGADVADALSVVHNLGWVHRDLKPGNVLFRSDGAKEHLILGDLGVAKDLAATSSLSVIAGSDGYMAPEQGVYGTSIDSRADLYSLGVLVAEIMLGRVPSDRTSLALKRDGVDPRLAEVVGRACATQREDRFDSAEEMSAALRAIANDEAQSGNNRLDGESDGQAEGTNTPVQIGQPTRIANSPSRKHSARKTEPTSTDETTHRRGRLVSAIAGLGVAAFVIGVWLIPRRQTGRVEPSSSSSVTNTSVVNNGSTLALEPTTSFASASPTNSSPPRTPALGQTTTVRKGLRLFGGPSFTADGQQVLVSGLESGVYQLSLVSLNDGAVRRISAGLQNKGGASVSQSSNSIVYSESVRSGDSTDDELFSATVENTGLVPSGGRRLTASPGSDVLPFFSSDATRIYFTTERDGSADVYSVAPDGTKSEAVIATPSDELAMGISRDGGQLAFLRNTGTAFDVFLFDVNSTIERQLTDTADNEAEAAISPDGTKVIFVRRVGDETDLFLIDAEGTETRLTSTPDNEHFPSFSPGGTTIAFLTEGSDGTSTLQTAQLLS